MGIFLVARAAKQCTRSTRTPLQRQLREWQPKMARTRSISTPGKRTFRRRWGDDDPSPGRCPPENKRFVEFRSTTSVSWTISSGRRPRLAGMVGNVRRHSAGANSSSHQKSRNSSSVSSFLRLVTSRGDQSMGELRIVMLLNGESRFSLRV